MNPEKDKEFEQNMTQLVHLLKKIMKHIPAPGVFPQTSAGGNNSQVSMNFFFFSLLPISAEELEEWEDLYDHFHPSTDRDAEEEDELSSELNSEDLQFLKEHGIRF